MLLVTYSLMVSEKKVGNVSSSSF